MSRLMSVAFTEQAVIERRKTVTRRKGWWKDKNGRRILKPGDHLTLCRKVMGRKPGEPLVRLAEVEVVGILRQPLGRLLRSWRAGAGMTCASAMCGWVATDCEHWRAYEALEMEAEGFPGLAAERFVQDYFIDAQHIFPDDYVTRIEWRYLDQFLTCSGCGTTYDATDPDAAGTCVHDNLCRRCWSACDRGRSCRDGCHERGER